MTGLLLVLALTVQDTVVLKPVVVTATRVPVSAEVVSSAITVLRGADLQARGIRTVAQALQLVPGAHIVETGSLRRADVVVHARRRERLREGAGRWRAAESAGRGTGPGASDDGQRGSHRGRARPVPVCCTDPMRSPV
jgi:outer membrane receptor protein involved in Fe transport